MDTEGGTGGGGGGGGIMVSSECSVMVFSMSVV